MIRLLSRLKYIFIIEKSRITELYKWESENLLKKVDALKVNNLIKSFKTFKQLDQRNSFPTKILIHTVDIQILQWTYKAQKVRELFFFYSGFVKSILQYVAYLIS